MPEEHTLDQIIQTMIPVAAALAVAVEDEDTQTIDLLLTTLSRRQLYALAIVFAAHIDTSRPLLRRPPLAGPTKEVVRLTAQRFGLTTTDLIGRSNYQEITDARSVAYYAAHLLGDSYPKIGRVMQRDHTTCMSGAHRVARLAEHGQTTLRQHAEDIATELSWNRDEDQVA